MKPIIPLHDARFKYVKADETDIRKLFAKVKAELGLPPIKLVKPADKVRKIK